MSRRDRDARGHRITPHDRHQLAGFLLHANRFPIGAILVVKRIKEPRVGDHRRELKGDRGECADLHRAEIAALDGLNRHHADHLLAVVQRLIQVVRLQNQLADIFEC
jgi:hypothetical protein